MRALTVRRAVKTAWVGLQGWRFHRAHATIAARILGNLAKDGKVLSVRDRSRCADYALQVLGSKVYSPWLQVYTAVSGKFREGWVPDNFYGAVVSPNIQGDYGRLSSLKSLSAIVVPDPSTLDLGRIINGVICDRSYRPMSFRIAKDTIFNGSEEAVFKQDGSIQGAGIYFIRRSEFTEDYLASLGNGVFQRTVRHHSYFDQYSQQAVATIRLTTVSTAEGDVHLRAGYLRVGVGRDTHVKSATHIRIPLSLDSGEQCSNGFTPDWRQCDRHPTSGARFANKVVPGFDDCVSKVKLLHSAIPFVRCIGWDVTVDAGGLVQVLEWNGSGNDIKFSEATQGPCFADLGWERLR